MKYLVVRLMDFDVEESICMSLSLDDAIQKVKEYSLSPYYGRKFKIYPLNPPLTVRYLDNKIFID